MSCGRLFHNVGAALENERSPIEINLVRGETKVSCADFLFYFYYLLFMRVSYKFDL